MREKKLEQEIWLTVGNGSVLPKHQLYSLKLNNQNFVRKAEKLNAHRALPGMQGGLGLIPDTTKSNK